MRRSRSTSTCIARSSGRGSALGESENDILRRLLLPPRRRAGKPAPGAPRRRRPAPRPRSRGLWSVEIAGRRIAAANLKHAYRALLRELAAAHPHFLEAFADEQGREPPLCRAHRPPSFTARSPHSPAPCRAARRRLVFRFEPLRGAGREARPDRRPAVRPPLRLRRAHPRQSQGNLRRRLRPPTHLLLDRAEDRTAVGVVHPDADRVARLEERRRRPRRRGSSRPCAARRGRNSRARRGRPACPARRPRPCWRPCPSR